MAHYDCKDCGASMGISYGSCTECTPQWVFDAMKACNKAVREATDAAEDYYAAETEELESKKYRYAEALWAEAQSEYELAFEAGKAWYESQQ